MTSSASHRNVRVAFVDHVARLSGGEIALIRLLPSLMREVDVIVILGEDGPLVGRLHELGVAVEVLAMNPRLRDVRRRAVGLGKADFRALALLPGYVLRLRSRLLALDIDIVHTNSLKAALYGGVAARLAGVPAIWHLRDRIATDYLPRSAVAIVHVAARALPTAVIANSHTTLATLNRGRWRRRTDTVVADCVEQRSPVTATPHEEFTVGVLGRLSPWKGQHIFLAGFAQAFRGSTVRGRIIGSVMFGEEPYEQELRKLAERLGIADQISFRGFREDIWSELSELDLLVHCSITPEPFGQVVLEGMAAGLPVIAAGAGGPAELITSGSTGILTYPGDARALAAWLIRLHEQPEIRRRLALAGQRRSMAFTPNQCARGILAVYRATLSQ